MSETELINVTAFTAWVVEIQGFLEWDAFLIFRELGANLRKTQKCYVTGLPPYEQVVNNC